MKKEVYCMSFKTDYSWFTLCATSKGISEIRFNKSCNKNCNAPILYKLKKEILEYLKGKKCEFKYPLDAKLSEFQVKLFKALKKYAPYGKTISYKELADKVNTSPRACGQALGANPLPIIIPCHRVIQKNGSLGGFGGGIRWKKALLKLEKQ